MSMPMQRNRDQKKTEKSTRIVTAKHHIYTWQEFLKEAKRIGLNIGLFEDYDGKGITKEGKHIMEEVILFDPKRGIIIYAYTFSGKSVNYAKLYGELYKNERPVTELQRKEIRGFNRIQNTKDAIAFAKDVSRGIECTILSLSKVFKFSSPWSVRQELEFVNIVEKDGENRSTRVEITEDKIRRCDPMVRTILGI